MGREPSTPGAPWFARGIAPVWDRLAAPGGDAPPFRRSDLDGLPAPVARWLARAVEPGTPLARTALLEMSGRILVGGWRRFTARQVISAGRGYVWAATAWFGPLPVFGFDRYSDGTGEMRWRLAGALPVVSASGDDIARSAAGRLAAELVLTPGAALAPFVRWEAVDDTWAGARVEIGGRIHTLRVEVDAEGTLRSVRLPRWGDPDGRGFAEHTFFSLCSGERRFGAVRLPARVTAGWDTGDRGGPGDAEPFIDIEVTSAAFR
ncbi:DUF6544 family protein [Nocardiopsis lambiniae]|uniref:DUF4166 domain-containing protein n=1 Tax=Nocardiopsis lambiniae TaxID=3075539 RepID=A0ABU2M652_9ACTN|nr:DUF6544 family protein [Nocardiopsis sp. DSM 44743]MDT0328144.1 hypothetical protein [Nocardiopsis sp. DSM 44743]